MAAPRSVSAELLKWYDRHLRDLPWRETSDPWAILISEVMLQQTRVEVVEEYFRRFLARFPTPESLARATDAELLDSWAGLGYYRRARNLRSAAQKIVLEHCGEFPKEHAQILSLPGVGPYTAGAVASIAFQQPHPVVDGNVARVFARLHLIDGDLRESSVSKQHWSLAQEYLDHDRPGDHNQALMELGALVCLPRRPRCLLCPLARFCRAKQAGLTERYPAPRTRRATVPVRLVAVLIRKGRQIALIRRAPGGLMEGLYDLPGIEVGEQEDARATLKRWLRDRFGIGIRGLELIGKIRHTVTHRRITADVFEALLAGHETAALIREHALDHAGSGVAPQADAEGVRFFPVERIEQLGVSAMGRKMLNLVGT